MKKFLLFVLVSFTTLSVNAANFFWNGSSSSDWSDGANWNQSGAIPGPGDNVQINISATITNSGATPTVQRVLITGTNTIVTLDFDLNVSSSTEAFGFQISSGAIELNLGNGTNSRTFNVSQTLSTSNSLRLFQAGAEVTVAANSILNITNGNNAIYVQTSGATLTNDGVVNITNYIANGLSVVSGGVFNNNGIFNVSGGSATLRILTSGAINNNQCAQLNLGDGNFRQQAGTITNDGYMETTSSTAIVRTDGGAATNNAFYNTTGSWAFVIAGSPVITDNGANVNGDIDFDAGGTCFVDFSTSSSGMTQFTWAGGGALSTQNGADGVLDLTGANFADETGPHIITISDAGCSDYNSEFSVSVSNVCPTSALPVELISFSADKQTRRVVLNWSTASEENNEFFAVEKSTNGREFEMIGKVEGRGTSSVINHYEFTDDNPTIGTSYYRLKQNDFDGQFEYSNIISVEYRSEDDKLGQLDIYPNPVGLDELTLRNAKGLITIFNIMGQPLQSLRLETNEPFRLNVADLPNGQYLLHVQQENGQSSYRTFVRQY